MGRMKQININGIIIEVEKKKIKNMYLKVQQGGRVTIAAPLRMPESFITEFAYSKYDWLVKQQEKLLDKVSQQTASLEYVTGDTLSLWGKPLKLYVEYGQGSNSVLRTDDIILLKLRKAETLSTPAQRKQLLDVWYRAALNEAIPGYAGKWLDVIGLKPVTWSIRDMKTRWGTCNIGRRNICLNLQLAKLDPMGLEYVIVHELMHFLEKSHNHVFKSYMDRYLPDWRERKAGLKKHY